MGAGGWPVKIGKNDLLGIGMTSQRRRNQLVERLREEGIRNEDVLRVIGNMPRHLFVPMRIRRSLSVSDRPFPSRSSSRA
jgi:protein-L-isoaspartate O-methyltransferase